MEKVKIKHKTLKIKIYPTNKQKKILNEWSNTFRYIANVTIEKREKDKEENNFYDLRNKIVTAKNVPEDTETSSCNKYPLITSSNCILNSSWESS